MTTACSATLKVPRQTISSEQILSIGRIEYKILNINKDNISLKFEHLRVFSAIGNTKLLGTLSWQSAWILKSEQPQWNAYMQSLHRGTHPGKASIQEFITLLRGYSLIYYQCLRSPHCSTYEINTGSQHNLNMEQLAIFNHIT